ncbi:MULTISPECIES: tetratricopeptide repeat protein [Dyella]|uniref:Tetratricopeptide repeat protein n=2 Tax=Dyella TaxID=231454 RepID=A0A4R0YHG4_9GAMM|nr:MULTISPECIES: tetratricopeptide repeat protein [Dyella]TBR37111.1 hypothetical protein EYV96_14600 [Dyella terrae]TCI07799.1 hypothetical protein EZM97_24270 [Dyella soli]
MNGRKDPHDHRTEPTLGDIDHLDEPPPSRTEDGLPSLTLDPESRRAPPTRHRPRQTSSHRGWLWPILLLVVMGLGVTFWLQQDRLRGMVPTTELNDVLGRAEQALAEGRLDGTDGNSARELFEAARGLEPDNDRARDGLRKVGLAEVARADAALRNGKIDEADQATNAARELLGGGSDVDRLSQAIAKARGANTQTDALVSQAQQALADGKAEEAGAFYIKVLAAEPGNAVATHGLDKVGEALSGDARKAIEAGDRATAQAKVDKLAAMLPGYGELPSLRAALVQDRKADAGDVTDAIKQGNDALRAGRIAGPGDDTALAYYKSALAIDPDNDDARAGLGQVAQALIVQANAALDGGDTAQARKLLDQAAELAPKSAELAATRAHLADLGKRPSSDQPVAAAQEAGEDTHPPLTAQQSGELARMVQRADAAARQGNIMLPPGESAYDLYRGALAIDGNNEAARRGLQNLPAVAIAQFNQAIANGNLSQASERLSDLGDLSPGEAGQAELRQRLAGAWLDQAEQQLARGNRPGAAQAIDKARKLAPDNPRLSSVVAHLQAGG